MEVKMEPNSGEENKARRKLEGGKHKRYEGACACVCVEGVNRTEGVKPVCGKAPQGWQLSYRVGIDPAITRKIPSISDVV